MSTRQRVAWAAVLVAAGGGLSAAWALQSKPAPQPATDVGALSVELMRVKAASAGTDQICQWQPMEYWTSNSRDRNRSPEEIESSYAALKGFVVIWALSTEHKPDGTGVYQPEETLRSRAAIRLSDGTEVKPIEKPPPAVASVLAAAKAYWSAGENADFKNSCFVLFPAQRDGKPIVNTKARDKLTFVLKAQGAFPEAVFSWRTPLDALSPAAPCAKCKGELSATWSFCPWCGQKAPEPGTQAAQEAAK